MSEVGDGACNLAHVVSSADELTVVPRGAARFPLAIPVPDGFDVGQPSSWPEVAGRLEYVEGRLHEAVRLLRMG